MTTEWTGAAGLAEDVRYYGQWMRDEAEKRIGYLYPKMAGTVTVIEDQQGKLKEVNIQHRVQLSHRNREFRTASCHYADAPEYRLNPVLHTHRARMSRAIARAAAPRSVCHVKRPVSASAGTVTAKATGTMKVRPVRSQSG